MCHCLGWGVYYYDLDVVNRLLRWGRDWPRRWGQDQPCRWGWMDVEVVCQVLNDLCSRTILSSIDLLVPLEDESIEKKEVIC